MYQGIILPDTYGFLYSNTVLSLTRDLENQCIGKRCVRIESNRQPGALPSLETNVTILSIEGQEEEDALGRITIHDTSQKNSTSVFEGVDGTLVWNIDNLAQMDYERMKLKNPLIIITVAGVIVEQKIGNEGHIRRLTYMFI